MAERTARLRLQDLREYLPALAAAGIGLSLSLLMGGLLRHYQAAQWQTAYEHSTAQWTQSYRGALAEYDRIGRVAAAFMSGSRHIDRARFHRFAASLIGDSPPVSVVGWQPRIPRGERQPLPGPSGELRISEAGEAGTGQALFPLLYAAPERRLVLGRSPTGQYDPRATALSRAVTSGEPSAAHGVPLPGEPDAASGVVVYYPVFRRDGDSQTLAGVVSVGFRPQRLTAGVAGGDPQLWITLRSADGATPPPVLYQGSGSGVWVTQIDRASIPSSLTRTVEAHLADLQLQATIMPTPDLLAQRGSWLPWLAGLAGLILTVLSAAFLAAHARRAQTIEQQVASGTQALLEAQSNLMRNAEARERTLQALRESESRYRLLADNATDVISRMSPDGIVHYVSPAVRSILGYEPEELVGRSVFELLPAFDVPRVRRETEEALRLPGVYTVSYRVQHAQGHVIWLEVTHRILTDPATGRPTEIISVSRDISARREAERALRESEALFRTVFEDTRVGMALFSPANGRFLRVNRALCEMLGYSRGELEERTLAEVTHPADQDIAPSEIQQVLSGEKDGYFEEKRYLNRSGGTVWVLGNVSLMRDSDGEPRYFIAQIQDISDRKHAEQALAQISHQRDLILNAAAEGIYGVDMDGYTTFVNEAAARMLGYSVEELVGVRMHTVVQGGSPVRPAGRWEDSRVSASISDQRTYHVEEECFHDRLGQPLRVQYVVSPIIENGRSTGAVVVFSPLDDWQREDTVEAAGS